MATIQVRDVREEDYQAIRDAAKAEGKSLQAYMQEQLTVIARAARKRAMVDALQSVWERNPRSRLTRDEIVADVRAGRDE